MTTGEARNKSEAPRHVYGPRGIAALLPPLLLPSLRRHGPATAQLIAEWPLVVGPAIAAASRPQRLFQGTLSIAASGGMALELQHLSDGLLERINGHLGRRAVTRLRFVQEPLPPPPAALPPTAPTAPEAAARAVAGLPPGDLRDALQRLGQYVLAPSPPA